MPVDLPDLLEVPVPVGGRAVVLSDLFLRPRPDPVSLASAAEVVHALAAWDGPGVVVVAGNLFDLLTPDAEPPATTAAAVAAALDAHAELASALAGFAGRAGRRLVLLPGSRDTALAWDGPAAQVVADRLGACLAVAADLRVDTVAGTRLVRVDAGQRFDPRFSPRNLRDPADSPLGHHLVAEIMPGLAGRPWATGVDRLADPSLLPRFVVSRLTYRGLARHAWWLLVPFVAALALKYPVADALVRHPGRVWGSPGWSGRLVLLGLTSAVDLVILAAAIALVSRRVWSAVAGPPPDLPGTEHPARAEARTLVTAGHHGLVVGHGLSPALAPVGQGFFAATGALGEVVTEARSWLGLPPAFTGRRLASWVELEAGADLHVRLFRAVSDLPGAPLFERLVTQPRPQRSARPEVVAHLPGGEAWPAVIDPARRLKRVRRLASAGIAAGALTDLVSAVTPPLRGRLHELRSVVPLSVSQAADAVVALAGVALVFLARGVRRGQRQAWAVAVALLSGAAVAHLVKGVDLEEAVVCLAIAGYLVLNRRAFSAAVDRPSLRWGVTVIVGGALAAFAVSVAALEVTLAVDSDGRPVLPAVQAAEAVGGRFLGVHLVALPHRLDLFLTPALVAVTIGLVAGGLWLASRPVVHRLGQGHGSADRARAVVARHGLGTLDYFALRSDKQY